jgi:hypothetical protein
MAGISYPITGLFVLIAFCLFVWMFRKNQKDKTNLTKTLPAHRLHRKRAKKHNLDT